MPRWRAARRALAAFGLGMAAGLAVSYRSSVTASRRPAVPQPRAGGEAAFTLDRVQHMAGFATWEYDPKTGKVSYSRQLSAMIGVDGIPGNLATVGAYVHRDDAARVRAARDDLVVHHKPFTIEFRLVCPDGRVLDVISSGEAVRDTSGRLERLWGTIHDVSEQRAAERAARDSARHAEEARADLEVEHQALQMFQRAMLPADLPRLGGVDLSAVYLPMAERIDIGGDWYDAFLLPDGRLALAVGDVTGHDLRAATVMGQVRNAVRAYATECPDPGTVLGRVNRLLARLPDLDLVTMIYGVYDPVRYELVWSNAGHPPPLLRRGGTVTTLTVEGGLLLGVVPSDEPYPEHRLRLGPEHSVLWYTDGIVDQRSVDPDEALERLCQAYARAGGGAGELLGTVSVEMLAEGQREDDVCLLVLRRAAQDVGGRPSDAQPSDAQPAGAQPSDAQPVGAQSATPARDAGIVPVDDEADAAAAARS
ncbi:PP2C family protein-serine/threonine phosphatase [Planosporangium mesophilum]|uniref:PAC domain-containing protein n=1 Tax=Planosporangium mesophilum TaxID=689768 RepID=A0A8J3TI04_9ACTN|nr:SpoIIE family protein phosphatase [Planosporangium mesophilum]NJC82663.1 SpoIIE family protein phosphatase [Planosporangium mesophilum]GII21810.1 hypothetical protein Pme01_14070 [Planosporangium mesophilum]